MALVSFKNQVSILLNNYEKLESNQRISLQSFSKFKGTIKKRLFELVTNLTSKLLHLRDCLRLNTSLLYFSKNLKLSP